jgi:hypothetical protein
MKSETFLKVVVILLMITLMLILGTTAFLTLRGHYDPNVMTFHLIAGFLVLMILPIHIYLRREKSKKLLKEFFSLLMRGKVKQSCTNHALLKTFKQRSLLELCDVLHIEIDHVIDFLDQKEIVIFNIKDPLEKIAHENSNDPLKIFAMIIENHYRSALALDQI